MKSMKKSVLNFLIKIGKLFGLKKLFWRIYELIHETEKSIEYNHDDKVFGIFTDSQGNNISLHSELRNLIKPGWQSMLVPSKKPLDGCLSSNRKNDRKLVNWRTKLTSTENYLQTFSSTLIGKDVLEIGAYDGATAYALADFGANSVLASDMAAYYITQTIGGTVSEESVRNKNIELSQLRDSYAKAVNENVASRVTFYEDDICSSSIPSESIDVIVSYEVLEHITRPQDAFREMYRILKPGGIAFHEYNPFFSLNGGHSLCTLDFLWGHARLNEVDFERYIAQIRPNERAIALSFYRNNLNRMTMSQLAKYLEQVDLAPISLLPWCSRDHFKIMTLDILRQCKHIYPTAHLNDLITPTVWVLSKKDANFS